MTKRYLKPVLLCVAGSAAVFLFPGCVGNLFKGKTEKAASKDSVVLAKIDNKAVITKDEFYKELASQMRNLDPSLLPLNMQRKILDDLLRVKLMVAAAKKSGIESDAEFKEALEEQADRLSELLLSRFYSKKIFDEIEVTDKEAAEDFAKNQDKYIKEPGGVAVKGISFSSKEKALAFYDQAKGKVSDFESIAKEETGGEFKDFGRVSKEGQEGQEASMVPEAITEAALKLSKLPTVDVVKVEKETWVIAVLDKQDPVLFEMAEIKDQLKNQLKYNKFKDIYEKHVSKLKDEFTVDINEDFFKEASKEEAPEEVNFNDDTTRTL